jgi:homoserine trans-succinylase
MIQYKNTIQTIQNKYKNTYYDDDDDDNNNNNNWQPAAIPLLSNFAPSKFCRTAC